MKFKHHEETTAEGAALVSPIQVCVWFSLLSTYCTSLAGSVPGNMIYVCVDKLVML